ncbi:response regulator [Algivirga pacifica]|uniref:Response regulator n=1 Tax=Algivirga pacifica TaxID=1162670 RepID=A0ABP9DM19_9BACT
MSKRVLIVDDSAVMRMTIKNYLENAGYEIVGQASNGEQAIDLALELEPDVITLDNILPDMLGLDILKFLRQEEEISSKIVMVSAVGQEAVIKQGKELGVDGYLVKPFNEKDIQDIVGAILKQN